MRLTRFYKFYLCLFSSNDLTCNVFDNTKCYYKDKTNLYMLIIIRIALIINAETQSCYLLDFNCKNEIESTAISDIVRRKQSMYTLNK